jgi:two-component system NarL family sensor kinase
MPGARRVRIDLALAGEDCVVRVADDGVGIPPGITRRSTSMGVLGMRERARSLGGTFELRSPPEGGALVTVRLPARPAAPTQECA